ncbi:proton-coupled amino acid transporter-like protein pathetic isoform X1 [Pieris brassicae]|uniref:proton-coupled amino acid transporter-like protein pathetic isoform X1 n=1 Tax=Pieris brassicae TaxID=7116 RepID=UPI001E6601C3|nr:proton-coupled amino acid transporter-like protein pathetic isoform X1 [Pieris brassicae]
MENRVEDKSCVSSTVTLTPENKEENVYNPFKHRNVAHPTSTSGSFFHLLKSSLGSGLLAMPAAFKNTGIIPGCFGTVLVGIIATHCVHILVQTSREICQECRVGSLSYTDTCAKVFERGPRRLRRYSVAVRNFADCSMAGVCLGGTSVYVIFIASSLKDMLDHLTSLQYSVESYCAMLLLPLVLLTQVRYLKFLVPFSLLANVCLLITFAITCFYTFGDLPDTSKVKLAAGMEGWPLFISTAIFAMEGINVVMPVENEMKKPQDFLGCPGVLNMTMALVVILYGVMGIFGYMKYGEEVLGSITLNLPQDENLALTAKVLVAIAVFFTYGLQMYAPMDILWLRIGSRVGQKYHNLGQIILRTVSVTLTVILAIAVPDLELLIGLVGAIFFSTLGIFIPAVIEIVHKWERGLGKWNYIVGKNCILLLIYVIVLTSGCYSSISQIIVKLGS